MVVINIREQLETKVFNRIGSTATMIKITDKVYNEYGDLDSSTETSSDIITVPYNLIDPRNQWNPFGNINEGEMDLALPYSTSPKVDDKIILNGKTYIIRVVEDYIMENISAAFIVRLYKQLD